MAVLYKSFQSVLEDKNHKKMFHPRVITRLISALRRLLKRLPLTRLSPRVM